jgi:hypothetical protein
MLFSMFLTIFIVNTSSAQVKLFTIGSQNTALLTTNQVQKLNKAIAENYESTKIIEVTSLEPMASTGKITVVPTDSNGVYFYYFLSLKSCYSGKIVIKK